jgi:ribosomal protein S27AE
MSLVMEVFLALILFVGIAIYAKKRRNKYHSKTCPRCGHYPCTPHVTNLIWKGSGGMPVYDYKCPKCGHEFMNNI